MAGTTLGRDNYGWDNFGPGQLWLGQLWVGTTLIWANYVWDNFGPGNFGPDNNGWYNFELIPNFLDNDKNNQLEFHFLDGFFYHLAIS